MLNKCRTRSDENERECRVFLTVVEQDAELGDFSKLGGYAAANGSLNREMLGNGRRPSKDPVSSEADLAKPKVRILGQELAVGIKLLG